MSMEHFRRHATKVGEEVVDLEDCNRKPVGLSIVRDTDGIWLVFETEASQVTRVHLDMIGPAGGHGSEVRAIIDKWQREFCDVRSTH